MNEKSVFPRETRGPHSAAVSTALIPHSGNDDAMLPAGDQPVSSASLLGGANTLLIEHMGMRYVLRATRNGKLILTK